MNVHIAQVNVTVRSDTEAIRHLEEIIMATEQDFLDALAAVETAVSTETAGVAALITAFRAENPAINFQPFDDRLNALTASLNQATADARAVVPTDAGGAAPVEATPEPAPVPDPAPTPDPSAPVEPADPAPDPSAPTDAPPVSEPLPSETPAPEAPTPDPSAPQV